MLVKAAVFTLNKQYSSVTQLKLGDVGTLQSTGAQSGFTDRRGSGVQ